MFTYLSETRPGVAFDACGAFAAAQAGAASGHMDCVAALAFCHLKGVGTAVNIAKAHELCSESMAAFSAMACFVQSLLHLESGAPATLKKRSAIPFLQIAAAAEINAAAAYNLAVLFSDTSDEFCDIPQAIQLSHFAAALGMQSAKDLVARLNPHSSEVCPLPSQPPGQLMDPAKVNTSFLFGGGPAASDAASLKAGSDPEVCDVAVSSFCSRIYVRASDAAGAKEGKREDDAREGFEVSSSAKACLAPNMLVMSEDGPFKHNFQLQFPQFDVKTGAFIAAAPAFVQSVGSQHVMQSYAILGTFPCPRCRMYILFCILIYKALCHSQCCRVSFSFTVLNRFRCLELHIHICLVIKVCRNTVFLLFFQQIMSLMFLQAWTFDTNRSGGMLCLSYMLDLLCP